MVATTLVCWSSLSVFNFMADKTLYMIVIQRIVLLLLLFECLQSKPQTASKTRPNHALHWSLVAFVLSYVCVYCVGLNLDMGASIFGVLPECMFFLD